MTHVTYSDKKIQAEYEAGIATVTAHPTFSPEWVAALMAFITGGFFGPNPEFGVGHSAVETFEECGGYDPWEYLDIPTASYSSEVDAQAIQILELIQSGNYNTDIAAITGLHPTHVELFQYIFCNKDLCTYGTSPRGCFPDGRIKFANFLNNWRLHNYFQWGTHGDPLPALTYTDKDY